MYLYLLPLSSSTTDSISDLEGESEVGLPTNDGGIENTAATFADAEVWMRQARKNEIILFPPQMYLLSLLAQFLTGPPLERSSDGGQQGHYRRQREQLLAFLATPQVEADNERSRQEGKKGSVRKTVGRIPWADKVISPVQHRRAADGRLVLKLDSPGPELKGSGRGGDHERVVLLRFAAEGPRDVEVKRWEEVDREEEEHEVPRLGRDKAGSKL